MNEPVDTYDLWEKFNRGVLNVDDELKKMKYELALIRLIEWIEKRNKQDNDNQTP